MNIDIKNGWSIVFLICFFSISSIGQTDSLELIKKDSLELMDILSSLDSIHFTDQDRAVKSYLNLELIAKDSVGSIMNPNPNKFILFGKGLTGKSRMDRMQLYQVACGKSNKVKVLEDLKEKLVSGETKHMIREGVVIYYSLNRKEGNFCTARIIYNNDVLMVGSMLTPPMGNLEHEVYSLMKYYNCFKDE